MIDIRKLCVTLPNGARLLRDVSHRFAGSSVTAVVGPNGAGKSTLLKVLSGDRTASGGEVLWQGRPLQQWPRKVLARNRGVLPQESTVPFAFTALEVVLLGRIPHGDSAGRQEHVARRMLARTGVEALASRTVDTLSGGERQRVHLARVLAQLEPSGDMEMPQALLLDEPTNNLDPAHQHAVLTLCRELAGETRAVVVVLHDLNLAAQYADTLLVLHQGRLAAAGPPDAVLDEDLLAGVFKLRAHVARHPVLDVPAIWPVGCLE